MKTKFCFALILLLAACQKGIEPFDDDPGSTVTTIGGTWNFISFTGNTQATQQYVDNDTDYSTTTISAYTSTNNTGSVTFNDSYFSSANIGYLVTSKFISSDYKNGVLVDTVQLPFSITIDSSNATGTYKLIGSDSIYFPEGGFVAVDGSEPEQAQPSGGKFSVSGNILTITQVVNKDTTEDMLGVPLHTKETGTFVIKLQKN